MSTISIKNVDTYVLKRLSNLNEGREGFRKCGTANIKCIGIKCSECPLDNEMYSLKDVRDELTSRNVEQNGETLIPTITESHKGGGSGIYVTGKPEPIEFIKTRTGFGTDVDTAVYHPKHYKVIDDVEAIQVIARSMTVEQFKGYCLGNILKYRLRLGAKDAVEQDLKKAQNYKDIFEKFKGLCHDAAK